jgi:hypothetical protein
VSPDEEVEREIDRLYALPLSSFTEERNALAARERAAGRKAAAERVKALPKPSLVPWALNQLFWKARPRFDAVVEATERLADAQRSGLGGEGAEGVRRALRERKDAVQRALRTIEDLLKGSGPRADAGLLQRVGGALEALTARGGDAGEAPGRLSAEVAAAGFDVALDLARGVEREPPPRKPAPPPTEAAVREAEAAAAAFAEAKERQRRRGERVRLENEAARGRRDEEAAARALAQAEERLAGARLEREESERRLDRAQAREARAREDVAAARSALQAAEAARRAADAARDAHRD